MSNDKIYTAADLAEFYEMALQSAARNLEDLLDRYAPDNEMRDPFLRMLAKNWREFKAPGRREVNDER